MQEVLDVSKPFGQLMALQDKLDKATIPPEEDPFERLYDGVEFVDDVSGVDLDKQLATQARRVEMAFFKTMNVYTEVRTEPWMKPISTRWIDINKGDDVKPNYRARLVGREIKRDKREDLFAATPPIESLRMIVSVCASNQYDARPEDRFVVMTNDVKRHYFYAPSTRPIYIMISDEDLEEGDEMKMDSDEDEMEMEFDSEEEDELPIDLTGASDEEILKVFKAMSDEDGIIVKQDDNQVHIEDEDADVEYIIQMESEEEEDSMSEEMDEQMDMNVDVEEDEISDEELDAMIADIFNESEHSEEMDEEMDEVVYEIEMDEEEDEDSDDMTESKMTIKPVMGHTKAAKLTTKAETKEGAIEPKGSAKGVGMNLKPKKFEFTEEEMEEAKKKKQGYDDREDEREAMKHGKIAGKDLKTTKARRDDAQFETRKKGEHKEAARTYGMGSKEGRGLRKGITNNRNYVYGDNGVKVESINNEVQRLREKNDEYRKALNVFREKLNEVAVFNSNLAYATRLFTEHTTTKQEKINILRRFDDVESLKESKSLYNSIKNELNNTTQNVVTESVSKIDKSPASGSAQNLIESKTYENPQFMRMKDIMQKIN